LDDFEALVREIHVRGLTVAVAKCHFEGSEFKKLCMQLVNTVLFTSGITIPAAVVCVNVLLVRSRALVAQMAVLITFHQICAPQNHFRTLTSPPVVPFPSGPIISLRISS
jgi:hypothetical protein